MLSETQKVWLACAIDGEGSISMKKNGLIVVTIANTCEEYVRRASELMNANYYKLKEATATSKAPYQAQVCSKPKVLELLKELLPYFIVKREKAQQSIDWIQKHPPLSQEEKNRRVSEGKRKRR
jgi:hypothetical protein